MIERLTVLNPTKRKQKKTRKATGAKRKPRVRKLNPSDELHPTRRRATVAKKKSTSKTRSAAAKKAAATRKRKAAARSASAKKAAATRRRRTRNPAKKAAPKRKRATARKATRKATPKRRATARKANPTRKRRSTRKAAPKRKRSTRRRNPGLQGGLKGALRVLKGATAYLAPAIGALAIINALGNIATKAKDAAGVEFDTTWAQRIGPLYPVGVNALLLAAAPMVLKATKMNKYQGPVVGALSVLLAVNGAKALAFYGNRGFKADGPLLAEPPAWTRFLALPEPQAKLSGYRSTALQRTWPTASVQGNPNMRTAARA